MPDADPTAAPGLCTHVPPSPGQSLCQCGHHAIELEYAARLAEADRPPITRELADFGPDGHLLATCSPWYDGYSCLGNGEQMPDHLDCAAILYAIAQDAERALAAVRSLAVRWQCPAFQISQACLTNHGLMCPGCNRAAQLLTALEATP